jgi:SMODS and SLOG-associating 2TM effector domain family 5
MSVNNLVENDLYFNHHDIMDDKSPPPILNIVPRKKVSWIHVENPDDAVEGFLHKMRLTAGARFEAARRHKKRFRTSNVSIIILSLYAMIASLVPTFIRLDNIMDQILSMLSLSMSVLVIAFTLLENAKRHDLRSELFLKCAQQILALHDRLKLSQIYNPKKKTDKDLRNTLEVYHKIIGEFPDNHSDLDLRIFLAKKGAGNTTLAKTLFVINIWIMPVLALLSPLALYCMIYCAKILYRHYMGIPT